MLLLLYNMKILFFKGLFSLNCMALSWLCDYSEIDGPTTTHVLYKEETSNIVKWLEKYEYCRAKGDPSVYEDAGQAKCEYSRNLCVFSDGCIFNQDRENDLLNECQDLLYNNILSDELDSGRIPSESDGSESDGSESEETESDGSESEETESEETESDETESEETESEETESEETESDETESEETESEETESEETESEETESEETESEETESEEIECTETETVEVETETETVELECTETAESVSVVSSSATLGAKSLLLLFSFPLFM
jgi:hypothetical protein